jgi:NAD(P)-dependent dehydrogenase (short-subunit alcohol dehydrogenase family)
MQAYKDTGAVNCDVDFDTSHVKGKTAIVTGGPSTHVKLYRWLTFEPGANGIGEAYTRDLIKAGYQDIGLKPRVPLTLAAVHQWSLQMLQKKTARSW